jgi:hypothetical protein
LLIAAASADFIAVVAGGFEFLLLRWLRDGALDDNDSMTAAIESNDFRILLIGLVQLALVLALAVLILRWIYLAHANKAALGAKNTNFRPGWAVGWFFVPIFNLWKPFQAMRELWNASVHPANWHGRGAPDVVVCWWILFLTAETAGRVAWRLSLKAETLSDFMNVNIATLASDGLSLPLNLVFIPIVQGIQRAQTQHARGIVADQSGTMANAGAESAKNATTAAL